MSLTHPSRTDVRCAIYTRKSSREGLTQPIDSLETQRLACSHFVASQSAEGWGELATRYDDGGHSGGTLARPALQALLSAVERGEVDVVVVYKIDRLTRSMRDFVRLIETFERHAVTFTAVSQQFSTTSSMGRLTLNILLAFAQFERELTGERTRDKFAALRAKGMRPGGGRPFGYQLDGRRLVVDATEAAVVQRIFRQFIKAGTSTAIPAALNRSGHVNHRGQPFTLAFVRRLLRNRLYLGDLVHRGQSVPGMHPQIISARSWDKAQAAIAPHVGRWEQRKSWGRGMLAGLVYGPTGRLQHDVCVRRGKIYRYYGPPRGTRKGVPKCQNGRFRAEELEGVVLSALDPQGRLGVPKAPSNKDNAELARSLIRRVDIGGEITIRLMSGRTITVAKPPWLKASRLAGQVLSIA